MWHVSFQNGANTTANNIFSPNFDFDFLMFDDLRLLPIILSLYYVSIPDAPVYILNCMLLASKVLVLDH